ncbi:unnamed protein product [Linum tenue]|uniref:WRKY domain-containing protein n=1 Tax=Linum tenue TaxID=586396 RepID=A0AAV0QNR5_9ROSI|nr:unnamed protein product [Linum tenue]
MENYQGDLTDIIRAGAGATTTTGSPSVGTLLSEGLVSVNWEFPPPDPLLHTTTTTATFSSALLLDHDDDNDGGGFGDPFFNFRDPLLHELHDFVPAASPPPAPTPPYFSPPHLLPAGGDQGYRSLLTGASNGSTPTLQHVHHHHSNNIFSRIQISSPKSAAGCDSSPGFAGVASPRIGFNKATDLINGHSNKNSNNNNINNISSSSSSKATSTATATTTATASCLIENQNTSATTTTASAGPPLQISSPRNLGIKRRKSQAKKVVCIPAPAAANSRPSGEVVPSDLWAWRKYGQKPIKGSPYPRGYYRCSSSKGCSARKQVERSRTDPNMLVITYTSEHNHPWPTQRNALAGSTRTHPLKHHHNHNNNATSSSSAGSKNSSSNANANANNNNNINIKENHSKDHAAGVSMSSEEGEGDEDSAGLLAPAASCAAVKEEQADVDDDDRDTTKQMMEMELEMNHECAEFSGGFSTDSYRPALAAPSDFFSDLGEIDADVDPLELLFSQGGGGDERKDEKGGGGGLEPSLFSMFDWSTSSLATDNQYNNITAASFGGQEAAAAAASKRD